MAEIIELVPKGAIAKTQEARRKSFRPSGGYRVVKVAKKAGLKGVPAGQVEESARAKTQAGEETVSTGAPEVTLGQETFSDEHVNGDQEQVAGYESREAGGKEAGGSVGEASLDNS